MTTSKTMGGEWQDMSSAPKDGTRVLVTRCPATGRTPYKIAWWGNSPPKGWRWRFSKLVRFAPTHWMPLPAPPLSNKDMNHEPG